MVVLYVEEFFHQFYKQNWHYTDWYDNPYFEAYEKIKSINNFTTNGSLSFKYEILPSTKLQLRAGGVAYANNNVTRSSVGTISKGRGGWEDGALGYYKEGKKTGFTMNYDFFLLFNKKLSDFSVDGLLGGSLYYTKTKNLEASTKNGLSVPGFYSIKASVESPNVDAETKTKKVNSLFGTLTLGYKDTYYLEATGRNDWSSTLPSNDKSYFYPSVGVSIIPSNIISLPDWIPFWKLRGSWTVSKTDLAIYDLDRAYTIKQNVWDGLNTASYPDYLRGDVKPITNRTWEIGTGIHFLQGHRLKLDVSYFNKLTYNNTISQRISSATGYNSIGGSSPTHIINTNQKKYFSGLSLQDSIKTVIYSHTNVAADSTVFDMFVLEQFRPFGTVCDTVSQKNNVTGSNRQFFKQCSTLVVKRRIFAFLCAA